MALLFQKNSHVGLSSSFHLRCKSVCVCVVGEGLKGENKTSQHLPSNSILSGLTWDLRNYFPSSSASLMRNFRTNLIIKHYRILFFLLSGFSWIFVKQRNDLFFNPLDVWLRIPNIAFAMCVLIMVWSSGKGLSKISRLLRVSLSIISWKNLIWLDVLKTLLLIKVI